MPYRDPEYVQRKIELIERGLPIDISEAELESLEDMLRHARSFSIDLLQRFHAQKKAGKNTDSLILEENKNIAGVELALRKIDEFREQHKTNISGNAKDVKTAIRNPKIGKKGKK